MECLFWRSKHSQVSSDLKPPLLCTTVWLSCEWAFKISKQIHICNIFFLIEKAPDKKVSPLVRILIQFSIQKRAYFLSNQVWHFRAWTLAGHAYISYLFYSAGLPWPALASLPGMPWPACLVCFVQSALACPLSSWGRAIYPCALMLIRP